jgi:hypothetical protein
VTRPHVTMINPPPSPSIPLIQSSHHSLSALQTSPNSIRTRGRRKLLSYYTRIPHRKAITHRQRHTHTHTHTVSILVVLILVSFALFADRDLDSLAGESSAERRAFDHAGEFLGRVDLEGLGVGPGEDWALSAVQAGAGGGVADIDEIHFESEGVVVSRGLEWERRCCRGSADI